MHPRTIDPALQLKAVVTDRWWPWRVGSIKRRTKTSLHVEWSNGTLERYDAAHTQFLSVLPRPSLPYGPRPRRRSQARG